MPVKSAEIKSAISNPAKILLGYMQATGITDAKTLATQFDIPIRTIQRLKLECASANDAISGADENANHAINGGPDAPIAPNTPDMALSRTNKDTCAQANKELPSEVNITSEVEVSTPLVPQAVVEPKALRSRGSRLTADWSLPIELRQWAEINTQLGAEGIALEAAKFHDHWLAQPGSKGAKADWPATWRNWCRNAGSRRPYSPGRMSWDERKADAPAKPTMRQLLDARIAAREAAERVAA